MDFAAATTIKTCDYRKHIRTLRMMAAYQKPFYLIGFFFNIEGLCLRLKTS